MDYYLQDPATLKGKPKRTIGDYVEQNGILVPRRFDSLAEARASGLPVIARSEHPQEYAGCSGILKSPDMQSDEYSGVRTEEELKIKALSRPGHTPLRYEQFCKFSGYDEDKFRQEVSFSFWELLGGYDRIVVADSAIPNRYHVTTSLGSEGEQFLNYAIVKNGSIVRQFVTPLTPALREGLPLLLRVYEEVRHLDRFDPKHCPIMEMQTVGDKNYFLQYHRGRDFELARFRLDRGLRKGEKEMAFVRGATQEGGMKCKVTVYYAGQREKAFQLQDEDGSWDFHNNHVFPELRVRQRKVQMENLQVDLDWTMMKFALGHLQWSKLFKPQVSIINRFEDFSSEGEFGHDVYLRIQESGENSCMWLDIVSDGRRSFVERLE